MLRSYTVQVWCHELTNSIFYGTRNTLHVVFAPARGDLRYRIRCINGEVKPARLTSQDDHAGVRHCRFVRCCCSAETSESRSFLLPIICALECFSAVPRCSPRIR